MPATENAEPKPVIKPKAKTVSPSVSSAAATNAPVKPVKVSNTGAKPKKAVPVTPPGATGTTAAPVPPAVSSTNSSSTVPGNVDLPGAPKASGSVKLSADERKKLEEELRRSQMTTEATTKEKRMLDRSISEDMKNPQLKERQSIPKRF